MPLGKPQKMVLFVVFRPLGGGRGGIKDGPLRKKNFLQALKKVPKKDDSKVEGGGLSLQLTLCTLKLGYF